MWLNDVDLSIEAEEDAFVIVMNEDTQAARGHVEELDYDETELLDGIYADSEINFQSN